MAKDVIVVVQHKELLDEKENLDILIISTTGACPVCIYESIEAVEAVFGPNGPNPNPKVVRKATTLFNQGKATLAKELVSRFKIVGFEPPAKSAALPAKFIIDFTDMILADTIPCDKTMWVKIGGDDKTQVEVTATKDIDDAVQFAELFSNTSFTKNGKTYTASVEDGVVTYTATVSGVADNIPEKLNIYTDEIMADELVQSAVNIKFVNGQAEISAADNLIENIRQFQADVDNDWYYLMTDRDDDECVMALAKFAETSEPSEDELSNGIEDHRKFYMGQTCNKNFACQTARAAIIYTDAEYLDEEPDASYTGNVAPFYPNSVTWKFKRPQNGNAPTNAGTKFITVPRLTEDERNKLLENHVNFLTEEYKHQYVKEGTCLDGEFIDVVLGGDWIAKRMRDLLYNILLSNANISYDDAGFGLVATAVLQALAEAVDLNIISKDPESNAGKYTMTIPTYAESTEDQRRSRTMPDITWEALLSGSIHQVKTKGVLRATL